jgi:hypothetical protein
LKYYLRKIPVVDDKMAVCGKRLAVDETSRWTYTKSRPTLKRFETVSSGAGENARLIYVNFT